MVPPISIGKQEIGVIQTLYFTVHILYIVLYTVYCTARTAQSHYVLYCTPHCDVNCVWYRTNVYLLRHVLYVSVKSWFRGPGAATGFHPGGARFLGT